MKYIVFLIIALTAISSLTAVIRTVDNNVPSIGQYATFDAAYNASANGDTIYLYPSVFSYGSPYPQKQLTIIGAGYDPANPGMVTSKIMPIIYYASATNTVLIGLDLTSGLQIDYPTTIRNCRITSYLNIKRTGTTVQDCLIKGTLTVGDNTTPTDNIAITGCIIDYDSTKLTLRQLASAIVSNSVFYGNGTHIYCEQVQTNASFNHCLFINRGTGTTTLASGNQSTATLIFRNSIFENTAGIYSNFTFQYNIFEGTYAEVTDPTNMEGVSMANVMVDVNNNNYHLSTGSVAIGAGLGGVDIGIYGGVTPFDDFYYLNYLPTITVFTSPAVVDQNGNLNIQIQGKIGN